MATFNDLILDLLTRGVTLAQGAYITLSSAAIGIKTVANSLSVTLASDHADVKVTLDSEVVAVDATGQGDVPVTLDGEAVALGAGSADIGNTKDNGPAQSTTYKYTTSADMTSAADIADAPTAGQKLVITDILISVDTDMLFSFKEETSGTVIGAIRIAADIPVQITPRSKWKLDTADKKLQGQAGATGNVYITVWSYSEA